MSKKAKTTTAQKPGGLFTIFGSKPMTSADNEAVSSVVTRAYKGFDWTDLESPKVHEVATLAGKYNLHDVQVHQSQTRGQISQMALEDDYIFLVLHFPHFIPNENRLTTSQVSIFIGKNFLITIHDKHAPTIRQCFNEHEDDHSIERSPGRIVFHLIEHLLKEVETVLASILTDLDDIEESVFNNTESDAFEIGLIRQKVMRLRRTLATQKNVLEELDVEIDKFTGERLARYYRSNTNATRKLLDTAEEARESIEIYKDADFTTSTEQTNKTLEALTLLFTLTIPATTIGCLYGMNVLIPGGIESGSWTFLGKYTAFELIVGISVVGAIALFLYFRFKK